LEYKILTNWNSNKFPQVFKPIGLSRKVTKPPAMEEMWNQSQTRRFDGICWGLHLIAFNARPDIEIDDAKPSDDIKISIIFPRRSAKNTYRRKGGKLSATSLGNWFNIIVAPQPISRSAWDMRWKMGHLAWDKHPLISCTPKIFMPNKTLPAAVCDKNAPKIRQSAVGWETINGLH